MATSDRQRWIGAATARIHFHAMRTRIPLRWAVAASCLALSLFVVGASPAAARTFYMSDAGNDDAVGSTTAPWASLNKANATMAAGDTLYVRAGTYSGVSSITWSKSGTAEDPVVISAYPGEHPLFNGNGADWLLLVSSQYTVIAGLEVTNYQSWAVQIGNGSDNVTVGDCYFHNILAVENAAVVTRECSNVTIESCVFEEMGRSLDQLKFDHALYNSDGSHDVTIRNNYFKNNYGGPAINNYHTPAPYDIYIYNNVFVMTEGAERSGIYAGTDGHDVDVYNNTFYADGAGATTVYGVDLSSRRRDRYRRKQHILFRQFKRAGGGRRGGRQHRRLQSVLSGKRHRRHGSPLVRVRSAFPIDRERFPSHGAFARAKEGSRFRRSTTTRTVRRAPQGHGTLSNT